MLLFISWILFVRATAVQGASNRSFKSVPTIVKTFENDTVLLPCDIKSLDVPTRVRWWREGVLLADSDNPSLVRPKRVRMWGNSSLEVAFVQPNDTGEYVCQASRSAPWGHVTQVHAIEVLYPPSVYPEPKSGELEVNLGEQVDMACVAKGVPVPIVTWRTKGEELPLLDDRPRLQFHAEHRNLSGRYTCVASNGVGEPATASIDLRIKYKPEIKVRKNWVHASPGIRAQLDCTVTAYPEAKVEWYFKEKQVPYSSRILKHFSDNDHSLVIRNVRSLDYGYYICRASNFLGTTESVIELSGVANPATFKKESRAISKTVYNFIWEVDSYSPIIEYQFWFRKFVKNYRGEWHKLHIPSVSDAIGPLHARSFNLTGLTEATRYEALVLSRNRYGWSATSKIFHFATEGAPADDDELSRKEVVPEERVVPIVELASMSHRQSPSSAINNAACELQLRVFLMALSLRYILTAK